MPLGWFIGVYRQCGDGRQPAAFGADHGPRVAVWQTGLGGLDWISDLVRRKRAVALGGNGYPVEYTARAGDVLPLVTAGPPLARDIWALGAGDTVGPAWAGKTVLAPDVARACHPDEWLILQAWDES